jgi:hypothetical protein
MRELLTRLSAAARAPVHSALEKSGVKIKTFPPWRFISLKSSSDFGFPHSRRGAIILPVTFGANALKKTKKNDDAVVEKDSKYCHGILANLASTIAHEYIHVLQRQEPEAFEELYLSLGYRKRTAQDPDLDLELKDGEVLIRNPDAVDFTWKFRGGVPVVIATKIPASESDGDSSSVDKFSLSVRTAFPEDGPDTSVQTLIQGQPDHPNEVVAYVIGESVRGQILLEGLLL